MQEAGYTFSLIIVIQRLITVPTSTWERSLSNFAKSSSKVTEITRCIWRLQATHSLLSLPRLASLFDLKEHTRSCYLKSVFVVLIANDHFPLKPTNIIASSRANHKPLLMRLKTTNNLRRFDQSQIGYYHLLYMWVIYKFRWHSKHIGLALMLRWWHVRQTRTVKMTSQPFEFEFILIDDWGWD